MAWRNICLTQICLFATAGVARGDAVDEALKTIAQTGPEGAGSADARSACDALSAGDGTILPRLLGAMQTPNPVAANWYRSAYEAIVARELARPTPRIPLGELQSFVDDSKHVGRVRRLALAVCERLQPGYSKKLIPKLLNDPEFRGDAVDAALAAGQQALEGGDSETARAEYQQAFEHARASEQVVRAADKLTALGEHVDIVDHLGLVVDWWVVGPFDAPGFSGFDREFPPEDQVDLAAHYVGQEGRLIAWTRHRTSDPLGLVNLAQAIAPAAEAVGYAFAELDSPAAQAGQLRCGADDNCTVWLNGRKVFSRGQWLNGIRFDRFTTPVELVQGKNRVLVKICQGPQHKDPQVANAWSLQLRFCDETGTGMRLRPVKSIESEAPR